jgi:hypothetical protein
MIVFGILEPISRSLGIRTGLRIYIVEPICVDPLNFQATGTQMAGLEPQ